MMFPADRILSRTFSKFKSFLDYSKVPTLNLKDIQEKLIRGSGPGGQSVNTSSNAVFLKHSPTGVWVKVHESRSRHINYKLALERLQWAVDDKINGEESVRNQEKRLQAEERERQDRLARERRELKEKIRDQLAKENPTWTKAQLKASVKIALKELDK